MSGEASFWDHLDELRTRILYCLAAIAVVAVAAFALKEPLFDIVLAPRSSDFVLYRLMGIEPFSVGLMNTGLTEQFMIHLKVAFYAGLLVALPFVLYEIFRFVSPALYERERRYAVQIVGSAYVMFVLGTLLNYFLIFPLTVKFLGTYQVSPDVANMLTLQSYTDTLITMSFVMGVVFELPVVCWILGRMGLISRRMMRTYRRHAVVVILIVAAIITPTTDAFTLIIVSLPIWMLYELSIWMVKN
ncbi:MAG: twin-arginine translocase subunit TatC [Prevotella sp.]|nr:twin-arginine translocase subunit TatC [Prevotella sp.]